MALWGAALIVAVLAGLTFWLQPWASRPLPVVVETVAPGLLTRVLAVNGRLAAQHEVAVRARVGGAVLSLAADEGDAVVAGETLMRIDPAGQQAAVRQALAALDAGLVAQADAEANFTRYRALGATMARVKVEEAGRAVQSAEQEAGRLTALLDQAQIALGYYSVTAPMSGIVLSRGAEVGQIVDVATDLFTLADPALLVVETDVDEAYATQIAKGQAAVLQLVGETRSRAGHVSFVAPRVDAATGGLTVELVFDAPVAAPLGLTVTANITVDRQEAAISVPRAAVVEQEGAGAVFVVEGDVVRRRAVEVVAWPAARLMILDGLAVGDQVIVDATGMVEGQAVRVVPPGEGTPAPKPDTSAMTE